jgi:hypothetical protein
MRLLAGFIEVGGTYFSSMKKTEMNAGTINPEVFQEIRCARWRKVCSAPQGKALGDRHGNKSTLLKNVNVRAPANPPIQTLGAEPVVIARSNENRDGMCRFKLGAEKLAGIW